MSEHPDAVIARMALAFIERATLKGEEVRAYVAVVNWLTGLSNSGAAPEQPAAAPTLPPAAEPVTAQAGPGEKPFPPPKR
jgi:hypothetical protein